MPQPRELKPEPSALEAEAILYDVKLHSGELSVDQRLKVAELYLQLSIARSLHEINRVGVVIFPNTD